MSAPTRPVTVAGGSTMIDAHLADLTALAARLDAFAHECELAARTVRGYLLTPELDSSQLLDPGGYYRFESALLDAVGTAGGLGSAVAQADALARELRGTVTAYEQVDALVRRLGSGGSPLLTGLVGLPVALGLGIAELVQGAGFADAGQAVITTDPAVGDVAMAAGGLQVGVLLGGVVPDGHGVVTDPGIDAQGVAAQPPRGLTDIVADLAQRDNSPNDGEIDVRILTMPDGSRRAIVDVTGTKSWNPGPTSDVTSLTTNERAIAGRRTAYEGGVLAAMRTAGVRKGDDVMIVGHSEGGMVAVNTARDAVRSGEFDVTHVITAGAPIGRTVGGLPAQVNVLALENRNDVVPHLDAADNPQTRNVTTVTGLRGDGTVVGDHDVHGSYLPIAADTQASHDVAVRQYERSANGYFHASRVTTHTYRIRRSYS
ncbi:hypothetical protein [uncultured Jatrophihabitans sp.]|uniref:hypothetical protein n=1 Tax=uncultured Jatrophihabitans sp. TaxID=1610747 RepID=UPI0035C97FBF